MMEGKGMKELMLGNKAVARGLYEAGCKVISSYPGTPSTEITEEAAAYNEIYCEWAPNEKVALEVAHGATLGGVRAACAMKHVGLNVAADPLFTISYQGLNAGLVVCVADDPGMHSSQNEQDSRHHAIASKIPMLEPSDSREAYEFATAKVIISNVKRKYPFYKKKGQYYIQTWHGCFMLKYIEAEVEKKLSARYVRESRKDSAITDLMLSGSGLASEVMHQSFWYSGEVYECGQPRDDIFFHCTAEEIRELKKKHRLPQDVKIAVYAPTFRDGDESYPYDMIDVKAVMDGLHQKGSSEWVMVIRLHPNVACQSARFQYGEKVLDGSKYTDPQELFLMADLLITDYSSVMMDFGLMKTPVFLFVPDLEVYKRARGVRGFFEDLPFPRCRSN